MKNVNLGLLSLIIAFTSLIAGMISWLAHYMPSILWLSDHGINHVDLYPSDFVSFVAWIAALVLGLLSFYFEKESTTKIMLAKISVSGSLIWALSAGLYLGYLLSQF